MPMPELNRRQFLQASACTAMLGSSGLQAWGEHAPHPIPIDVANLDPHLALAWSHQFTDHDVRSWGGSTRLCGVLSRQRLHELNALLDQQGVIKTVAVDGANVWVTLAVQEPALMHLLDRGLDLFQDHIWGAPWFNPVQINFPADQNPIRAEPRPNVVKEAPWPSALTACRQRLLIIDHGFPLQTLRQKGVAHLYKRSPMASMGQRLGSAQSHGAQVTGLLLHGPDGRGDPPDIPLLLYELPDEILYSMPYAALWPDVIEAISWAVSTCPAGTELVVMMSLISTDGDRHPQSFISRSARALNEHALSKGVKLTWVMAAGNSHADQQNIALDVQAGQAVEIQWHLPAQNFRPSFMECWFDKTMGLVKVEAKPPEAEWSELLEPLSMAQRLHGPSGRAQVVLRLPPTAAWLASQPLAVSGAWAIRLRFERSGKLDAHLSMMTASSEGVLRQGSIQSVAHGQGGKVTLPTLSGLIPWTPQVVVAQALHPYAHPTIIEAPHPEHLSAYSGRWLTEGGVGWRAIGVKVDTSNLHRGLPTWTRHGHRIHRSTGTSMAVPLVARHILRLQ